MRDFLVSVSGARPDVLAQCPSDRAKFEGLGGAVLTTSVLATLSMWFALYSALGVHPLLAIPVALIWGLIILSLDRWLVSSIPAEGARRWQLAVPRFLMALLLGAVISTPLVLQIFHPEINAQIVEIKQRRAETFLRDQQQGSVGQEVARANSAVTALQKVISSNGDVPIDPASDPRIKALTTEQTAAQRQADQDYREWQCQLYGGKGCPKKGNGPLAAASKTAYDKSQQRVTTLNQQIEQRKRQLTANDDASKQARLNQARQDLPGAQAALTTAQRRQAELQKSFDAGNKADNGLLIRLQALNEVAGKDATLQTAQILLFLLFLLIECLPVTVKLMQKAGNYEKILKLVTDKEIWEARGVYAPHLGHGAPGGEPADGSPDQTIREIWYGDEAVPPEHERTLRPRPAAASPEPEAPVTMADEFETSGEYPSHDDMALREMEDTRAARGSETSDTPGRIQLWRSDEEF